jgi:predicted dehydrogenase
MGAGAMLSGKSRIQEMSIIGSRRQQRMRNAGTTRRTFVRQIAVAGVGLTTGVPTVIGASVRGAGRPAPSNRISLACIGVGGQGARVDLKAYLSLPNAQVVAVCDVDSRRLAAAKKTVDRAYANRDCGSYRDFREVMIRDDIDAVHIATPDHWHVPIAITACKHGKDVYCQKPLSLTVREARQAVRIARRYARVFQMGTQNRSNASARLACELVRNGRLGELKFIEVGTWHISLPCSLPAQPVPPHVDWELFLGPAPWRPFHSAIQRPKGWIRFIDYSGGGVTDCGAHFFDLVQWALGTEDTGPVEITPLDPRRSGGRFVRYRYANGATVYRTNGNHMRLVGSLGTIDLGACAWASITKTTPTDLARSTIGLGEVHLRESVNHYANFLECVRTREKPAADVELGCRAATICHIGNIAEWLGRPLRWNPDKEEFVGDQAANRWLDRAKREPWL